MYVSILKDVSIERVGENVGTYDARAGELLRVEFVPRVGGMSAHIFFSDGTVSKPLSEPIDRTIFNFVK